jgi:hypothetical protein
MSLLEHMPCIGRS